MKKIGLAVGALLFFVLLAAVALLAIKDETVLYDSGEWELTLKKPAIINATETMESERTLENTRDVLSAGELNLFGFQVGTYEVAERTLGNGAQFVFERLENTSRLPLPLETAVGGLENGELTDWNPTVVEHEHHPDFGIDPTVNPFGVIRYAGGEMLHGNAYLSKELETAYAGGGISRMRELDREVRELEFEEGTVAKSFWLDPQQLAESWMLVAEEPLFASDDIETEWVDYALHNQTVQLNWLTIDGPYTKLPFSIEPGTQMGYGRAMGRFEDDIALDWNEQTPSVFFETMVLNSRANLLYYLEEHGGTRWPTEYTSTWLKNAYGVTAPYVDTRFNEYVAFYLDETARLYPEDIEQEELAVGVYADYLLTRIAEGETIAAGDGLLIIDYFDEDPDTALTHASLNHELGGLKILLAAYGETNKAEYLEAAQQVIAGIEQFGQEDGGWIRDNGDLWYQARPDGTFSGDDYPQLTLLDLLETQALFEELGMERNAYFDEMIDAKLAYLESENVELIEKVTDLLE